MQATKEITRARRTTVLKAIASEIERLKRCQTTNSEHYAPAINSAETRLENLQACLPSGSGIDCGTKIDIDKSNTNEIVLHCSYHHMNDNGFYDGWTEHKIRIWPTFDGFDFTISGRNRNDVKEYLEQCYHQTLSDECDIYSDDSVKLVWLENLRDARSTAIDFQI